MIYKGGTKSLTGKFQYLPSGKWRVVQAIYKGARLVWLAIRSCFGRGYWIEDKPWLENDVWRDNR